MSASRCLFNSSISPNRLFRQISTTRRNDLFWEREPKSGYGKKVKLEKSSLKHGFQLLKTEFALFKKELVELWESDPILLCQPGFENKLWQFKSPEDFECWTTTADSDNSEGFSKCTFALNSSGKAVFAGKLSTEVPKDGRTKKAGYCSIRTLRAMKSFMRDSYWDWSGYSHIIIRCRGDGRSYMLNIHTSGYFDQTWNDTFHYPLYTRGGPYWQTTRIPFSKFFFSSKGRIQDLQNPIALDRISHLGITASDSFGGEFQLEIDYIGLTFDPTSLSETFAYEQYKLAKGIAAT